MLTVNRDGLMLQYTLNEHKSDIDIIKTAIANNKIAILFADSAYINYDNLIELCTYNKYTYNEIHCIKYNIKYNTNYLPIEQKEFLLKQITNSLYQYIEPKVKIFNRQQVLSFIKDNHYIKCKWHIKNIDILYREIIFYYKDDVDILVHIDINTVIKYNTDITAYILYRCLLNTKSYIINYWDYLFNFKCLIEFNIEMIYNTVLSNNIYIILFDEKYYDCRILNLYAVYYAKDKYKYYKLYLMRSITYDKSFVFDNVINFLIKYI
jgi:hypothetical protein